MAQLKDLLVAGPSRLIGDLTISSGAISEGDIIPSESGKYLGASGKTWRGDYITNIQGPNVSGAVNSATQLQTARTLWGQSFNGTDNANGCLYIQANSGNWTEGIRIKPYASWTTILLGGNDLTADTYTSAKSWSIHNNDGNFYITKNGSTTGTSILKNINNVWSWSGIADGNISGNAASATNASNIYISNASAANGTIRYLTSTTGTTAGNKGLQEDSRIYYYDAGGTVYLSSGDSSNSGGFTLHNKTSNSHHHLDLITATLTADRTITFPDYTGTVALFENAFWANVKISRASSIATEPIFKKVGISDGTTQKAYWQFNSEDNCIDLVFGEF